MSWDWRRNSAVLGALVAAGAAAGQQRVVESVVPALAYGPLCSSTLVMQNLSERPVVVEVEAHKPGGALAPLVGHPEIYMRLQARERVSYKVAIEEETESAWVKVRERVPRPEMSPVVAVSGMAECVAGDQLRTVGREVVYPTMNPWFAGDVTELRGGLLFLINTSERAVKASVCYSGGSLYSTGGGKELAPICSSAFEVQIPPFGARQFPVARDGSTHFSLKTQGGAMVLQMLRPLSADVKMYRVDSTIQFGSEVVSKR